MGFCFVNVRRLSLKSLKTKIYARMLRSLAWISTKVAPKVANGASPKFHNTKILLRPRK